MKNLPLTPYHLPMILFIAAALRLFDLGAAPLWYDESFTSILAGLPLDRLIAATAGDVHPPLYYLLDWVIVNLFGNTPAVLRIPSALASLLSVYLIWQVGRSSDWPDWVTTGSALLMAVLPFQIHFAQEARQYALLQMLVLVTWLAILRNKPVTVFLAVSAMLWTHNYGLFYAAALGMFALAQSKRWQAGIPFAAAAVTFIPWAFVLLSQMRGVAGGYWIQDASFGTVLYSINMLFWAWAIPAEWITPSIFVSLSVVTWALYAGIRNRRWSLLWLAAAPLVMALVVSYAWKPIYLFRALIGIAPALYALVLHSLKMPAVRWQVSAAMLPLILVGLVTYYQTNPDTKAGRLADSIATVRAGWKPGDLVVYANDGSAVGWMTRAADLPQVKLPSCGRESLGAISQASRDAMGIHDAKPYQFAQASRLWVVVDIGPLSSQCEVDVMMSMVQTQQPKLIIMDDDLMYSAVYLMPITRSAATLPDPEPVPPLIDRLASLLDTPKELQTFMRNYFTGDIRDTCAPQPPETFLQTRAGDCKDKATFAGTILAANGADPVLMTFWFTGMDGGQYAHAVSAWHNADGWNWISNATVYGPVETLDDMALADATRLFGKLLGWQLHPVGATDLCVYQ